VIEKKFLFLLRRRPYTGSLVLETIDSILVAGVFDQQISVLFRDDGIFQLLKNQQGQIIGSRSVNKVLSALPEYGITDLFVCGQSLSFLGLAEVDLAMPVVVLNQKQQTELIAQQQVVLND